MGPWVAIAGAYALCLVAALAYYPCLGPRAGRRLAACLGLSLGLLALPLGVPGGHPASALARFVVGVLAVLTSWRLYDLHVGYPQTGRPPLRRYLTFVIPDFHHAVYRRVGREPGPGRRGNLLRLARGVVEVLAGGVACFALWRVWDPGAVSFALEHTLKWLALYPVLDGGLLIGVAGRRLLGLDAMDIYRDPIRATTPADFWRRYNRVVGEWLFVNVCRRGRLRRKPALACMAAFAVSAVMHEYLLAVSLGRIQGYQLAFFLSHGVAATLTQRVRLRGWQVFVGWALTVAFTLATLVLFTASVEQVFAPLFAFYGHGRPALWAG